MKKGYTLIEILIVATIIVLLTAVAVVSYSNFLKQSRDSKRKTDLEQIRAALEMYRSDKDSYFDYALGNCSSYTALTSGSPKYIQSMPSDPKSSSGFYYSCEVSASDYTVGTYLETGTESPSCGNCGTTTACNYCVGPYGKK
ncbi:MAG: type II secretion system protein [Patescibacteria group bacterium]|jgi:general secretion pathway protein G